MAFESFQNYPAANIAISGVTFPTELNTTFYYGGSASSGYTQWITLSASAEGFDYGYVYVTGDYWFLYTLNGYEYFRAPLSASNNPWEITQWEPYDSGDGAGEGIPVLTPIPFNKSNIIVSGIDPFNGIDLNGEYILGLLGTGEVDDTTGLFAGRPVYLKPNGSENTDDWDWVYWNGSSWAIFNRYNEDSSDEFYSNSNTYYPPLSGFESTGTFTGTPVITFAGGSEFQRVANLHGGIPNFLRLHNLGYF